MSRRCRFCSVVLLKFCVSCSLLWSFAFGFFFYLLASVYKSYTRQRIVYKLCASVCVTFQYTSIVSVTKRFMGSLVLLLLPRSKQLHRDELKTVSIYTDM